MLWIFTYMIKSSKKYQVFIAHPIFFNKDTMLVATLFLVFASLGHSLEDEYSDHDMAEWENFLVQYPLQTYGIEELESRRNIFMSNLKIIHEHNSKYKNGEVSNELGINKYTDMLIEESPSCVTRTDHMNCEMVYSPSLLNQTPQAVDWRAKGAVTEVKNQHRGCGACWAFSATGALEGQIAIKNGQLVSLSEQNLVDCDTLDSGCGGGWAPNAFKYIAEHGIASEKAYPYEGKNYDCQYEIKPVARDRGCHRIEPTEDALKIAVAAVGPMSVVIDAGHPDFKHHKRGIYNSTSCSSDPMNHDHELLVVGYGTSKDGVDYWIVKNSWGKSWGEDGYIRMARGYNRCGIANHATYPVI